MLEYAITISSIVDITNSIYQLRHNKEKKTIYGISFDYALFSFLHSYLSILTTFLYIDNSEYTSRNPIYPTVPISYLLLLLQIIQCSLAILLCLQLRLYHHTQNTNQGVSPASLLLLLCLGLLWGWLFKMYSYGEGKIVFLDVIDSTWYVGRVVSTVKYVPVISMNWFDRCVVGFTDTWHDLSLVVVVVQLLGKMSRSLEWWEVPVNFPTWTEVVFQLICMLIIKYQMYIYKENKSTLQVKHK
ncbi:hypothetical protein SBY92_002870 [Candida maltosa Xu316]